MQLVAIPIEDVIHSHTLSTKGYLENWYMQTQSKYIVTNKIFLILYMWFENAAGRRK